MTHNKASITKQALINLAAPGRAATGREVYQRCERPPPAATADTMTVTVLFSLQVAFTLTRVQVGLRVRVRLY